MNAAQTLTPDNLVHFVAKHHGHEIDSPPARELCQMIAEASGYSVEFIAETVLERRHRLFLEGLI